MRMNKLLTTVTLLCFSVAANADIYFCETTKFAFLDPGYDESSGSSTNWI